MTIFLWKGTKATVTWVQYVAPQSYMYQQLCTLEFFVLNLILTDLLTLCSARPTIIFTDSKHSTFTQCITTEKRLISLNGLAKSLTFVKSLAFAYHFGFVKSLAIHKYLMDENLSNMTERLSSNNLLLVQITFSKTK